MESMRVRVRVCKNGCNNPPSTHARTHISRECDLLAIISRSTTGFRLNESDQTGAKVHFLPRFRPRPARTQMSNLPHAPKVWVLPPTTLSSPPGHTQKFWKGGGTEPPLPSRTSGPTVLFSAQVTWSPARLPGFLCPSFSAQNDARGAPNRDGTSTRLRFGSARFCRAEKCRRKAGARRCEGSGLFQDWRPPPAPRPAHQRGPRSPPAPPHGHSWNCSWSRTQERQRFIRYS